jgi:pyruvate carboxylase subunit B
MKYAVEIAGRVIAVEVTGTGVTVDGRPLAARLDGRPGELVRHLVLSGRSHGIVAEPGDARGRWRLSAGGERLEALVLDERARAIQAAVGRLAGGAAVGSLRAPMPGLVLRVLVAEGEEVHPGRPLVVVEAMKMENELKAAGPGVVRRVLVAPGDAVEKGAVLVELGPSETTAAR